MLLFCLISHSITFFVKGVTEKRTRTTPCAPTYLAFYLFLLDARNNPLSAVLVVIFFFGLSFVLF